jgi:hypothetical protein
MRSRQRWLTLLAAVLLAPVLGGCSAIPGWSTATPGASAGPGGQAGGQSWVVVTQGSATPSPTPSGGGSPSASPTGFLPLAAGSRTAPTPAPQCTSLPRQAQINGLTVVAGPGSASVTWYHPGDGNPVSYRLTAMPQHLVSGVQPALSWQTIVPRSDCGTMTATVTGLTRGRPYILSLDAVSTRSNTDGEAGSTVARSGVIYPT